MVKRPQGLPHDIYIELYNYYQQLAINEDRLFNERLMVFLTCHSILFLGFVMCFQVQYVLFHIVGIFLSFVGIALCVFGYILVNPAWKAWVEWQKELKKIETELKKELKEEWEVDLVFPFELRSEVKKQLLLFRRMAMEDRLLCHSFNLYHALGCFPRLFLVYLWL